MSTHQNTENQARHLAGSAPEAGFIGATFDFRRALTHRRLDPGRYLMLMRQYHGRSTWRRSARFAPPAES
jgi:hypothetical protein